MYATVSQVTLTIVWAKCYYVFFHLGGSDAPTLCNVTPSDPRALPWCTIRLVPYESDSSHRVLFVV